MCMCVEGMFTQSRWQNLHILTECDNAMHYSDTGTIVVLMKVLITNENVASEFLIS